MFNDDQNQYEDTANEVFAVANSLGDEVRHATSQVTGLPEINTNVIMTASNAATALYEYGALQFRIRLKDEFSDKYEFEAQDNMMVEAFAKVLMIPAIALHKIITNQSEPDAWENILHELPFSNIDIDYYIEKVNDIINEAEV